MSDNFIIFLTEWDRRDGMLRWQVVKTQGTAVEVSKIESIGTSTDIQSSIDKVRAALEGFGYRGEDVLLGVCSDLCIAASVDNTGLRQRNQAAALRFRLEEQLPLPLEEINVDFISGGKTSLGVIIELKRIAPFIQKLETAAIAVRHLCPIALLAAMEHVRQSTTEQPDLLLCIGDNQVDAIAFEQGRIASWTLLAPDLAGTKPHLLHLVDTLGRDLRVSIVEGEGDFGEQLSAVSGVQIISRPEESVLDLAIAAGNRVLSGTATSPIDFRHGPLACADRFKSIRRSLAGALVACILLTAAMAVSFVVRTSQYNRVFAEAEKAQLAAFEKALPQQTPPPLIISRLASEAKRLRGLSGMASNRPPSLSILPLLNETLCGLPSDMRFRFLEMRFEPERFYLEGQTLGHGDADRIAAALRKSTGFNIEAPHTEQPPGKDVSFTVSGAKDDSVSLAEGLRPNP